LKRKFQQQWSTLLPYINKTNNHLYFKSLNIKKTTSYKIWNVPETDAKMWWVVFLRFDYNLDAWVKVFSILTDFSFFGKGPDSS
jgi:hypothetical protein